MTTLIDTSAIIDLTNPASPHLRWSRAMIFNARRRGPVFLNPIVLAECLAGSPPVADAVLETFARRDLPWPAASLAGRAHGDYRRRGGGRTAILADFLIGAHAAVEGLSLLTRDPKRIAQAFSGVRLITPETDPL